METDTKEMLEEQIQKLIVEIENLTPGSDEHVKACDALSKLCKILMEETHNEAEFDEIVNKEDLDMKRFKLEQERMKREASEGKRDRMIQHGINIGGILIPTAAYIGLVLIGLKFEETGTITSTWFRNVIGQGKIKR